MNKIGKSELIINEDGTIFHLHLKPEDIADNIILVGDQSRVDMVSSFFDKIDLKVQNREFKTHTGYYNGKRITALSTGIGTDNIDIVINELDALCNIDLQTRTIKTEHRSLNLIRIGTSGSLQANIPVDTPVASQKSIGFDGLLNFYEGCHSVSDSQIVDKFIEHTNWHNDLALPYIVECSESLLNKVAGEMLKGFTISAPGFYGPQGRVLRLPLRDKDLNSKISSFEYDNLRINNFEMESSAIYGLSKLLGHEALTVCNIIANRIRKEYSGDYKKSMSKLIKYVLDKLVA